VKRSVLLIVFLASAVTILAQQKPQEKAEIKQVPITAEAVSKKTAEKPYTLDLTRNGKVYSLAKGVDYERVKVHTVKGDMTVAELIKKSGKNVSGPIRLGTTSDIRAQGFNLHRGGGGLNYDCGDLACVCQGDDDCNDLFTSNKCGPIAVCYPDGCICIRL
jgi:hypothetical protein